MKKITRPKMKPLGTCRDTMDEAKWLQEQQEIRSITHAKDFKPLDENGAFHRINHSDDESFLPGR